jgi:8-oxo-dGTP diphosphatase
MSTGNQLAKAPNVGVAAVIFNNKGEILLSQRGPNAKNQAGFWAFPGGAVQFGETLSEALQRELLEELNVDIDILQLVSVFDDILVEEQQHWVSPAYVCCISRGDIRVMEPTKISAVGWFARGELPEDMTRVARVTVNALDKLFTSSVRFSRQMENA